MKTSDGALVTIPADQVQDFKTLADMRTDMTAFNAAVLANLPINESSDGSHKKQKLSNTTDVSMNEDDINDPDSNVAHLPKISQPVMQNMIKELQLIRNKMQQAHDENEAIALVATDIQAEIVNQNPAEKVQWTEERLEAPASLQCDRLLKLYGSIMKVALLSDPSMQLLCDDNAEYCALIKNLKPHTKTLVWHQLQQHKWTELRTLTGHTKAVNSAAFSPDGTKIVTASEDYTARIWNAQTGECMKTLTGHTNEVNSAAFSPDGTKIVTASWDKTAKIWNAQTDECMSTLTEHTGLVHSATFSHDGTMIVTASGDHSAKIWNVATGQCMQTLTGHDNWVLSATFSPDDTQIATASDDKTAKIWNVATGQLLRTLTKHDDWVRSAAFSPDGKLRVTASGNRTAKIWHRIPAAHDFDQALFLQLLVWAKRTGRTVSPAPWIKDVLNTYEDKDRALIRSAFPNRIPQEVWNSLSDASSSNNNNNNNQVQNY